MKVSIVYWSGTGNTEAMANAVAEGAKNAGAEVELLPVSAASTDVIGSDALLFGCPAMGAEELEESEFEPFFSSGLAAPQWAARSWKRASSSRFSRPSKVRFRAKKWGCSALTIGATANGCALGSREWKPRAA